MKKQFALRAENGTDIITFNSIGSIEGRHDGKVVSEPIEEGSFTTYNKTTNAIEYRVVLYFTGSDVEIGNSLTTLEKLKQDIIVFSLVTPYFEKQNLTLGSFYYTWAEISRGLLPVEVHLTEIREVTPQYTSVVILQQDSRDPSNTSTVDTGTTQTEEATEEEESWLFGKVGRL